LETNGIHFDAKRLVNYSKKKPAGDTMQGHGWEAHRHF
jgi:hypothetical protein